MNRSLRTIIETFLSFPCAGCRNALPDTDIMMGSRFCQSCLEKLPLIKGVRCPGCGGAMDGILEVCTSCLKEEKRPWRSALALFQMKGYGQKLIHQFKYNGHTELARPFGQLAAELLRQSTINPDLIVPMPLYWSRYLHRGYNQAELLATVIAQNTGIPLRKLLRRIRYTRQQARLNREERKVNIKNAFSVKSQEICENRSILLVDDVLTTGSTLASAVGALNEAGAAEVNIIILARGY